jgi:putative flippase GtrA
MGGIDTGKKARRDYSSVKRWLVFNLVGGFGILLQLAVLATLTRGLHWHYLVATACAVEAAVVHNFVWHERWTWAERAQGGLAARTARLGRFHLTNGAFSLAGNVLLMSLFAGRFGMNYTLANLLAIGICSVLNFFAGDRLVYIHPVIKPEAQADGR